MPRRGGECPGYLTSRAHIERDVIELLVTLLYEARDGKAKYKRIYQKNVQELEDLRRELVDIRERRHITIADPDNADTRTVVTSYRSDL